MNYRQLDFSVIWYAANQEIFCSSAFFSRYFSGEMGNIYEWNDTRASLKFQNWCLTMQRTEWKKQFIEWVPLFTFFHDIQMYLIRVIFYQRENIKLLKLFVSNVFFSCQKTCISTEKWQQYPKSLEHQNIVRVSRIRTSKIKKNAASTWSSNRECNCCAWITFSCFEKKNQNYDAI